MILPTNAQGERLDRAIFLALDANGVETSVREVRRALQQGLILVNERKEAPGLRVTGNERINLNGFSPRSTATVTGEPNLLGDTQILARWPDILALNKPSGWACAPIAANERGTLLGAAVTYVPSIASSGPPLEGGLAHRLDIGTSGVVLFGTSSASRLQLRGWFSEHKILKTYLAVVKPAPTPLPDQLDAAIRPGRKQVRVEEGAGSLPAISEFEIAAYSSKAWLVCVRTYYGRRHQVRAHLAHMGAAIHGDLQYGGMDACRLMLHAYRIDLPDGRWVAASLPKPFSEHFVNDFNVFHGGSSL